MIPLLVFPSRQNIFIPPFDLASNLSAAALVLHPSPPFVRLWHLVFTTLTFSGVGIGKEGFHFAQIPVPGQQIDQRLISFLHQTRLLTLLHMYHLITLGQRIHHTYLCIRGEFLEDMQYTIMSTQKLYLHHCPKGAKGRTGRRRDPEERQGVVVYHRLKQKFNIKTPQRLKNSLKQTQPLVAL